ncbi:MAG TPA: glycosyltransferase family 2 protein [Bryobacteraceae bacterium]|nr:glycosyltransferase family 2 protein [Bryobacteraceae bacterium]
MTTVSVIMACRNESKHIRHAIESLLNQDTDGLDCEYLIADGASDDGTRQILNDYSRKFEFLRVISNEGKIVSSGLNAAIAASRGDVIVRMDAHTEYAPDYVQSCVRTLFATNADNVGGPARTKANGLVQKAVATAYHSAFSCGGARFHDAMYKGFVDTVTYGCWLRSSFDRFGLFDETLVRNQDDEHNLRIVRNGGRIWQSPEIVSWYRPRSDLKALFRQYFQYGFWKVKVIRKHRTPASVRHLVPGAFVLALMLLIVVALMGVVMKWPVLSLAGTAALALTVVSYGIAAGVASFFTSKPYGWGVTPLLPLVFSVYHLAYGSGFIAGLLHSMISGDGATPSGRFATGITR